MSAPQWKEKSNNEKKTMNNAVEKQDLWIPETPAKPSPARQSTVEFVRAKFDLSSSKKRKSEREINDSEEGPRKKIYRPKVVSQISHSTNKSQVKSNTQETSTREKKCYMRIDPSCQGQLFDENSSTIDNELGVEYNSMKNYHKVTSLPSLCLVEDKQVGPNFPFLYKKKRAPKQRMRLQKLLTPFNTGKRSKSFIRRRRCCIDFKVEGHVVRKELISRIKKIRTLEKNRGRKTNKLVVYKGPGQLIPYKGLSQKATVSLDEETSRVWNLLINEEGHKENDEMKQKYWDDIREMFRNKVSSFLYHMNLIQGNRRFLPWKGSVVDSVVGVFLTQNVGDSLSSSAYMTLAAEFPVRKHEPIQDNTIFPSPAKFDKEIEENKLEEMRVEKTKDSSKVHDKGTVNNSSLRVEKVDPLSVLSDEKKSTVGKKNIKKEEKEKLMEKKREYWDTLRKLHTKGHRDSDHMDSVDWEAVRCAQAGKVADAISLRGQHRIIGGRIQQFLNNLVDTNGSVDLEWLRYAPPKEVKEYLLTIHGLGLKSVECIRLLALQHSAFPVDINVARIVVRVGWVPLQPLPEPIQIHNLEMFPDPIKIQEYLWPRLCTLDPRILYELHYHLITFGKVFCTMKKPNCNACPLKRECKYFASALASAKFALPGSTLNPPNLVTPMFALPESTFMSEVNISLATEANKECEPIIEFPASPGSTKSDEFDVQNDEESYMDDYSDIEDIQTIKLNSEETHNYYLEEFENNMNKSTALVVLHENAAKIPLPKMKNISRLRTERVVYVLPDKHPVLVKYTPREPDDPSPFLLVVWTTGELENSCESIKNSLQEEENSLTVPGTLLIPCRTAMRGRFPLNGTYFQVNEVFVDHASMIHPINVPRDWLWNLEKRIVYFGTRVPWIVRDFSMSQIRECFCNGFVCTRAFDVATRSPRPISPTLHRSTTAKLGKRNKNVSVNKE